MKKNIREDFKELRKSKGYATRDQLMGSIEKYCKEKQIEKINIKTIQRMENDHKASDKTIEIVSSVLSVPIEELTSNNL